MKLFFLRLDKGNGLRWVVYSALLLFALYRLVIAPEVLHAASYKSFNGFDISNSEISVRKIMRGGPPRDGIPAINNPRFVTVPEANIFMQAEDRVVGLEIDGQTRVYPVKILNFHEIVNDSFNGQGIFISYCPLCGTAMAFRSRVNDRDLSFGVSGLLYNSDVLMYDQQTESLWSQIMGRAISGPFKGATLQSIPVIHTSWQGWLKDHPQTRVLSTNTGYKRDYANDPYAGYADSERLWFRVNNNDGRYSKKEWVIGLELDGVTRAWPYTELEKIWKQNPDKQFLSDSINGQSVKVFYQPENRSAYITSDAGTTLTGVSAFWFAWIAFHPESEVFTVD